MWRVTQRGYRSGNFSYSAWKWLSGNAGRRRLVVFAFAGGLTGVVCACLTAEIGCMAGILRRFSSGLNNSGSGQYCALGQGFSDQNDRKNPRGAVLRSAYRAVSDCHVAVASHNDGGAWRCRFSQ
jgi:hypothetical protein